MEVTQKRLEWWRVCGSQESKRTIRDCPITMKSALNSTKGDIAMLRLNL
jgi:hypothetical protein